MKKIVLSLLLFVFILSIFTRIYAYNTSEFSITVPGTYKEETENSFSKEDGTNVNVQITPSKGVDAINYTEKELNYLVNQIETKFDSYKDELKVELKKQYGNSVSEERINEVVQNFKCNSIDKKEITTATKNKYKCYHIIANISAGTYSYYIDQYSFASNNKFYTLTASAQELSTLETDEIKGIIDSFTIVNYKAPKGTTGLSKTMKKIIPVIVCAIVGGILGAINKMRMKKETKSEESVKTETTEIKDQNNVENKTENTENTMNTQNTNNEDNKE